MQFNPASKSNFSGLIYQSSPNLVRPTPTIAAIGLGLQTEPIEYHNFDQPACAAGSYSTYILKWEIKEIFRSIECYYRFIARSTLLLFVSCAGNAYVMDMNANTKKDINYREYGGK